MKKLVYRIALAVFCMASALVLLGCGGTGSPVDNGSQNGNGIVNNDPKTIIITGIPMSLAAVAADGIVGIFPVAASNDQAIADFTAFLTGGGNIQHMVAGNFFDDVDDPELNAATGSFDFTVPLRAVQGNNLGVPWTGSGTFNIFTGIIVRDSKVLYRINNVSIATATTTIQMPAAPAVTYRNFFPSITGTLNLTGTPPSGLRRVYLNVNANASDTVPSVIWWNESNGENAVDFTGTPTNIPWAIHASNLVSDIGISFPAYLRFKLQLRYDGQYGNDHPGGHVFYSLRINSREDLLSRNFVLGDISFNP